MSISAKRIHDRTCVCQRCLQELERAFSQPPNDDSAARHDTPNSEIEATLPG